ncbi:MAG: hypothetical protein ACTSRG_26655 [Candidatus Helarchaeota archaeon]
MNLQSRPIPDTDKLYRRVPLFLITDRNKIPSSAFIYKRNSKISVDWSEYSTPEQTLSRGDPQYEYSIIEMLAGAVRELPPLDVKHKPEEENMAHSEIIGLPPEKRKRRRMAIHLKRISKYIINPLEEMQM